MAFKKIVFVFQLFLFMSACSVRLTPRQASEASPVRQKGQMLKALSGGLEKEIERRGHQIKVQGPLQLVLLGQGPHQYLMVLNWPKGFNPKKEMISIYVNQHFVDQMEAPHLVDYSLSLRDGTEYSLEIRKGGHSPLAQASFVTPKDTTSEELTQKISQTLLTPKLKQSVEVQTHRLFLLKGQDQKPSLITQGLPLVVDAEELIAEEAFITTYASGQKAALNNPGRSGAPMTIKVKTARGDLRILMRGEEGGDGSDGPSHTARAASGQQGRPAQELPITLTPLSPGLCLQSPGNGSPGRPGLEGFKGQNGRRGGDSGILKLEIALPSPEFHLQVHQEGGKAGAPGKGGAGQSGGLGGKPGINSINCNRATTGAKGADGPPGKVGETESAGDAQPECLSIGEGFGRCG